MISHVVLQGKPGSTVLDHETGRIIGTFDVNGLLDTRAVAESVSAPVIERLKGRFPVLANNTLKEEKEDI